MRRISDFIFHNHKHTANFCGCSIWNLHVLFTQFLFGLRNFEISIHDQEIRFLIEFQSKSLCDIRSEEETLFTGKIILLNRFFFTRFHFASKAKVLHMRAIISIKNMLIFCCFKSFHSSVRRLDWSWITFEIYVISSFLTSAFHFFPLVRLDWG